MLELPNIDFSELYCSNELEAVGIKDLNSLVKPAITALITDAIQRQITACNLSKRAADKLVDVFDDEGFAITLDNSIRPDIAALPTSFTYTSNQDDNEGDNNYTAEQQKALNYASWIIESYEFNTCTHLTDGIPTYPLNLLNAIFEVKNECHFYSPELMSIMRAQFDSLLGYLTPIEENFIRAIYQDGKTEDDLISAVSLQNNELVTWAMHKTVNVLSRKALRKLKNPVRSKHIIGYLQIISYLENVEGATLDDIRKSILYQNNLSWKNKSSGELEIIDLDKLRYRYAYETLFDVCSLPANLIFEVKNSGWCRWPMGLLMGATLENIFPNCHAPSICSAFFSTDTFRPHYLLAVGQSSDDKKIFALLEFIEGNFNLVQINDSVLKNLYRIIEDSNPSNENAWNQQILYDAEQKYCELQLHQVTNQREKEYYNMYLELIKNQRDALLNKSY